ncbi:tetratricopeptide repeat protein [Leeuwenhoekiella marinoflava]|uniref:tetratricopeptide repeat-containing sensor histidine kinase n=1 Tax=Leeuwenhoekiella marinoflava TaxID=988 RepID=UPI0030010B0B
MKKTLLLLIYLLLISCTGKQRDFQSTATSRIDSTLKYFEESKNADLPLNIRYELTDRAFALANSTFSDTIFLKILYQKNWLHFSLGQYDSLIKYDKVLSRISKQFQNELVLGKQNYLMGYYYEKIAKIPDSAFVRYSRSKTYYQQVKDSSWIGKNLLNMANIQQAQSDFFGSKETLTEALQYLDKGNKDDVASAFSTLGTNHRKLYNYKDAEEYFLKAIALTESEKNRLSIKNNLAATHIDNGEFARATKLLNEIAENSTLKIKSSQYARVLDNLAYATWLSDKPIHKESFLKPLNLRKQVNDKRGMLSSYTHLGAFYSKTEPQRAEAYFDTVIQLSKAIRAPKAEEDALKYLMLLFPDRLKIHNRYIFLQDSLYKQELKVKTQFAKYKYDDRIKQEAILRLEKENAEAELEATRERNYRYWLLAGFTGLIILIGVGIYTYRQRIKRLKAQNRADRVETSYATEAALSQRLHDDFGAGLHHLMLLVQSKADSDKILDELEKLYQQSRDFSREINAVDTGVNFKEALYTMLDQIKPEETRLLISGGKDIAWKSLSNVTKITLYKVLRELFINMSKHSQASLVAINMKQQVKELEIRYSDNGVGIDTSKGFEKNGLLFTEKRIEAIGGTITFESDQDKGFKSVIKIPNY